MAKKRDFHYVVPMPLEQTMNRLRQITDLGIQLDITEVDADTVAYRARRMKPRRDGTLKVVDETGGQMRRVEEGHTQVDPVVRSVANWQLLLFYGAIILLGLLLAGGIAFALEGIDTGFGQRALAVLIVYGVLFVVLQPQRFVFGSARDARFGDFIHDVLKGPYADPKSLYEQYFSEARYWETRTSQ